MLLHKLKIVFLIDQPLVVNSGTAHRGSKIKVNETVCPKNSKWLNLDKLVGESSLQKINKGLYLV